MSAASEGAPADVQRSIYRTMVTAHGCDERFREMINRGEIFIFYYSPRGQEAIPAAVCAALRPDDRVVTTYRGLHDQIAKGVPLGPLVAEFLGRAGGTDGGKGGPMHITDPDVGLMVTTGIVGGGLPIANGLALAAKLRGEDRVTVCFFGDGATNIGGFHEALNLAAVWDLPVVFVCQNNEFGEFTPRHESQRIERVAQRADAYGMPGVTVDGNDPLATYAAARDAIARARGGDGPMLVECSTYRFMGHFYGDPMGYMDPDQLAAGVAADPVAGYRQRLVDDGTATEAELANLEAEVAGAVDAAFEFAKASPPPDADTLLTDVYAQGVPA